MAHVCCAVWWRERFGPETRVLACSDVATPAALERATVFSGGRGTVYQAE
jgi:hypothetical protein